MGDMDKVKLKKEIRWWGQRVKNVYHFLVSAAMVIKYGYPAGKLTVIGVTGTDGKTTTCTLIYEILKAAGDKTALISTVVAKIGDQEIETGLHTTNPDARQMQPLLARMVKAGVTHLVMEVTAHGLDQYRVWGCNFYIGVLTNITHEHLDDFVDMRRYISAKAKLFRGVKFAVLNGDDLSFRNLQFSIYNFQSNSKPQIIKYSKTKLKNISPALFGGYNLYNIGAAEAVCRILEIRSEIVELTVGNFSGVPGRREEVKVGQKFRIYVDFAHTPNALEQMLRTLQAEQAQQAKKGKIILVFGCTGERDKDKRPMMGEIAARLADVVIVTSDDTRMEDQNEIARQIVAGIEKRDRNRVIIENDRRKAIEMAVGKAKPGDAVLLAGKGHEKSILIGKTERHWSDKEEVIQAFEKQVCL